MALFRLTFGPPVLPRNSPDASSGGRPTGVDASPAHMDAGRADRTADALGTVSFKNDIVPILESCQGCHNQASDTTAYAWLEGTTAAGRPCAGKKRISVLVSKVSSNTPVCGARMPKGGALDKPDIDKISVWVAAGAPNNARWTVVGMRRT